MHRAEKHGLGRGIIAQLRGLRRATQHEAGTAEARHEFSVLRGNESLRELRAHVAAHILRVQHKFFDEKRDTGEWSLGQAAADLCLRLARKGLQYRVEFRIQLLYRLQGSSDKLLWLYLLAGNEFGESESVLGSVFVERKHGIILQ